MYFFIIKIVIFVAHVINDYKQYLYNLLPCYSRFIDHIV